MNDEIVGVLIGASVAGVASIATTYLSNAHARRLQSDAGSIERREKSRVFQRDNLLCCQELLLEIARLTSQALHEDKLALSRGVEWKKNLLSEQLDHDLATSKRRFSALIERVASDVLRAELRSTSNLLTHVLFADSVQQADCSFAEAIEANERTMELLGTILRELS